MLTHLFLRVKACNLPLGTVQRHGYELGSSGGAAAPPHRCMRAWLQRCASQGGTMSDIFISYAREDHPRVAHLATALEQRGWAVWWDPAIRTGEDFGRRIHTALQAARCVIVV